MESLTTEKMLALLGEPAVWATFLPVLNSMVAAHGVFAGDADETLSAREGVGDAGALWDAAAACAAFVNAVDVARAGNSGNGVT